MKKMMLLVSSLLLSVNAMSQERQAPPSAHFLMAGFFAVGSIMHYDRAVKYEEKAAEPGAIAQGKSAAFSSTAKRMKFRATLLGATAGVFLLSGSLRLVLDDGLVGVRKEIRF